MVYQGKQALWHLFSDSTLKSDCTDQHLKGLTKQQLVFKVRSWYTNFLRIRDLYKDVRLENFYLKRRIAQLERRHR